MEGTWFHEFLREVRLAELAVVEQDIARLGPRVLEVGAGFGWQAERLAKLGLEVVALDIESSKYTRYATFPIQRYDGNRLPFPDGSFDVVFSSQMLHEVSNPIAFLKEQARVLKSEGTLIHSLPSAQVRAFSVLFHYIWVLQEALRRLRGISGPGSATASPALERPARNRIFRMLGYFRHALFPSRLGTRGTWLHEIFWFSEHGWRSLFARSGLRIKEVRRSGLCYSLYTVFGSALSLNVRKKVATYVGSSSLFILAEQDGDAPQ